MKKRIFAIITIAIIILLVLLTPKEEKVIAPYHMGKSYLLQPQKNVVILALELNSLKLQDNETIRHLDELLTRIKGIDGVNSVDSILNAKIIKSENEDIVVKNYYPGNFLDVNEYPELLPYIDIDTNSLLVHVYFGYNVNGNKIFDDLQSLQKQSYIPFSFTGRNPITAQTEKLISKDILVLLPLLFIGVFIVFLSFRSLKAILLAWLIIGLSVTVSFMFVRYIGLAFSPMLMLVPIFALGLLSDYIIHYFYHLFYSPHKESPLEIRKSLIYPISLTAISTLTGFLSLVFINASGHTLLGSIVAIAVILTYIGVMLWLPYIDFKRTDKDILPRFSESQIRLFSWLYKNKLVIYILVILGIIFGLLTLPGLKIEPYPIEQLPETSTIKKAENIINNNFFGSLPFFIEVDTGKASELLKKDSLKEFDRIHREMNQTVEVGYSYSLLTILKRINYYFLGDEESLISGSDYDDVYESLIEQFLLYYSSSVDPIEYESLIDSSYRYASIKGYIKYNNVDSLTNFLETYKEISLGLPKGWSIKLHGVIKDLEQEKIGLTQNWIISFGIGCFLIFLSVLFFYKKIKLALLSLIPGFVSMILSFGIISLLQINIDSFSIIFVSIITGLVIDYSIHTLAAIDRMDPISSISEGFSYIHHYSGIPIFLSFMTSLLSFSVLFLSSFRGCKEFGDTTFLIPFNILFFKFFSFTNDYITIKN
jgi:uncharacterized protein